VTDETPVVKVSESLTLKVWKNGSLYYHLGAYVNYGHSAQPYEEWDAESRNVVLDGSFSADELRAIVALMADAAKEPK